MADFSDVLLTVDYDRTLTGPDTRIPERNLEAIRWFMDQGGAFTVNTGRSLNTYRRLLDVVPTNAPLLLYNGSAAYENGQVVNYHPIELDMWSTVLAVSRAFPELNVEIQALDDHYLVDQKPSYMEFCDALGWHHSEAIPGADLGPFIKFAIFGQVHDNILGSMFVGTQEEIARFEELKKFIRHRWDAQVELYFAAPRILDVHAKGVSKGRAARDLQRRLGKKLLVCAGDADNDIPMLDEADHAFCPADGVVADRYETVCNCADGAVADVIYKKIPEILRIQP